MRFSSVIMKAVKGRRIPLLPSHRTIHLMAKAAVVVYETAVEVSESETREGALSISSSPSARDARTHMPESIRLPLRERLSRRSPGNRRRLPGHGR